MEPQARNAKHAHFRSRVGGSEQVVRVAGANSVISCRRLSDSTTAPTRAACPRPSPAML